MFITLTLLSAYIVQHFKMLTMTHATWEK